MPIVNNLVYQNDSWINKPHSVDDSPPLTLSISKPPLPPPSTTPINTHRTSPTHIETPTTLERFSTRKSPAPPPPPPPPRSAPLQQLSRSKVKSFCLSSTRRKTLDFSFFRETGTMRQVVRPRSMDTFDVPPPPVPGFEPHNEKPLPAVPIEPKRTPTTTSTITTTSSLSLTPTTAISPRLVSDKQQDDLVIDFEPLTLKDITLILDRNDRMAAYDSAYAKCMNTPSPLLNGIKKKKDPPVCPNQTSCNPGGSSNAAPRRSLTLPSLPSMITKKVAHLQYQFTMEGYIL